MIVRGASRTSFAGLTERLEAEDITSPTVATRLGDELFAVVGLLDAEHGLRRALASTSVPADPKDQLLSTLLRGKVTPVTLRLITQMVTHPRGRALPVALDMCASIAARRREQLIAVVRSAVELTAAQQRRLVGALAATYGHRVHLNVVIDPSVVGGIS